MQARGDATLESKKTRSWFLAFVATLFLADASSATLLYDSFNPSWLAREAAGPNGDPVSDGNIGLSPDLVRGLPLPITGSIDAAVGAGTSLAATYTFGPDQIRIDFDYTMIAEGSVLPSVGSLTRLDLRLSFSSSDARSYRVEGDFLGEGTPVDSYQYILNFNQRSRPFSRILYASDTSSFSNEFVPPTPSIDWPLDDRVGTSGSTTGVLEPGESFTLSMYFDTQLRAPVGGSFTGSGYVLISTAPIPEPSTALLLGLGLAALSQRQRSAFFHTRPN